MIMTSLKMNTIMFQQSKKLKQKNIRI